MSKPENWSDVRLWLRYSLEDLEAAEALAGTKVNPRQVCFLAQQAAEKAVKAILVFCQIEFPKSHDLEALVNMIPEGWTVKSRDLDFSTLTEWAVEARYPGDWPEATHSDAQTALAIATQILRVVTDDFSSRGLRL